MIVYIIVEPPPRTTLKHPSGIPASVYTSANASARSGVFSAGLNTRELPHANAGALFQAADCSGSAVEKEARRGDQR